MMPNKKLLVLRIAIAILFVFSVSATIVTAQPEETGEASFSLLINMHLVAIICSIALSIFFYSRSNLNMEKNFSRSTNNIVSESRWDALRSVSKTTGTITAQAQAHLRAFSEASKEDREVTDDDLEKAYARVEKFSDDCINIEEVQRFKNTSVREIMTRDVITLTENDRLSNLWSNIQEYNHLGYPVVKDNELVGVVTLSDLNRFKERDWERIKIGEVMTAKENLVTTNPASTLAIAVELMQSRQVGRIPVMEGNELKGIISRSDIIKIHFR